MASTKVNTATKSKEESIPVIESAEAKGPATAASVAASIIDNILKLLSSVRFGLVMLSTLLACCLTGMLIMQVNVEGFQKYYAALSPAKKAVWGHLGFFDIYHSWYFTLLLAVTGLNIILASIDRFPAAWLYIVKPKLSASPKFVRAQMFTLETTHEGSAKRLVEGIGQRWRRARFRVRVTEEAGRTTIFGQRHAWNRLGAYAVHVALLTIFTGGFLTTRFGAGGSMQIMPGRTSDEFTTLQETMDGPRTGNLKLPFKIECTDLQQTLIRPEGGLDAQNTIDWLSYIRIIDGNTRKDILVHLNNVGDYRGYRFFQSQFTPFGSARSITVSFEPVSGGTATVVTIPRDGEVDVDGIGKVRFVDFYPDFSTTAPGSSRSGDYNNPVARLEIIGADGSRKPALALGPQSAQVLTSVGARPEDNELLVAGRKVLLKDFEKVARGHTLTIQYDPGRKPVYVGFALLLLALSSVFFFSHQRVWAVIDPQADGGTSKVYFGGNVNRNRQAFEDTFKRLTTQGREDS